MWRLEQIGTIGPVNVCFTPEAIRADVPSRNLEILCKSPDWKVVLLNKKEKLILSQSLKEWTNHGLAWNMTVYKKIEVIPSRSVKVKLAGIDAQKFTSTERESGPESDPKLLQIEKTAPFVRSEYIYARLPNANVNMTTFMSGLYNVPMAKDVPLAFSLFRTNGNHSRFYTKSVTSVTVPTNYFDCPSNYKLGRDQWKFLVTQSKQKELERIGEDLGLGTAFGSK